MSVDRLYESSLAALTSRIEFQMGWGNGLQWSTRDFEQLSVQIHEHTGVQLSVVTLKRVWGKIEYAGKPTITTLDALSRFAGAQNWQQFKQLSGVNSIQSADSSPAVQSYSETDAPQVIHARSVTGELSSLARESAPLTIDHKIAGRKTIPVWIWGIAVACTAAVIFYVTAFRPSATSRGKKFAFSSKKVVETGVPNTVIFDYDAASCDDDDSVSIQQSWDPKLSKLVNPKLRTHTSIYYYPGFFDARLKVNGEVVRNHKLLIKSEGWLPLLETSPVPVYFDRKIAVQPGRMSVPLDRIRETGISLQPEPPWCSFYYVGDMPLIRSDDFIFEAGIRNDFGDGAAVCRYSEVHILFEGAAMVIPLSLPGCVSNLEFYDKGRKVSDLSPLGAALDQWVNVRFQVLDTAAQVIINNKKAFDITTRLGPLTWVGMIFKFRGAGSVDFIRVSRKNGEVVYEESFGDSPSIGAKALSLLNRY